MASMYTLTYANGETGTAAPTIFDMAQAERHMQAKGYGSPQDSPVSFLTYACYMSLRREGKTDGKSFDEWAMSVTGFDLITTDEDSDPLA